MSKLFGTDGVRGIANDKLTPELAFQIGQAAGAWLVSRTDIPDRVILGRDTRKSGPMLGAALAAGFCSVGVDAVSVGICPTGGISYLCRTKDFGMAAVISASHNPAPDNGIKLIASDGRKLSAEGEEYIESHLGQSPEHRPTGAGVGKLDTRPDLKEDYLDWLETLVPERLEGMKLLVDAADGAAYQCGPDIFRRLGADVVPIGTDPDGMNINANSGATKTQHMQTLSVEHSVQLGIAFDGDADRAVFSDSQGNLINGDRTMAIWASHWKGDSRFNPEVIVGTVMSNGGFASYLEDVGVEFIRTNVGDKYVSAKLLELGGKLGGEQSGHLVFSDLGPTGDGLVTALELARVLKRTGRTAADFYHDFENWPQLLVNVEVSDMSKLESPAIADAIDQATNILADRGRINLRPSGTQPMIRLMVEASDAALRDQACEIVLGQLLTSLGGRIYSRVDLTHALGD